MIKNYDSIQLFKKNRETDGVIQELLTKEDLPNSEQLLPEVIIRPLEFKDKETSSPTNSENSSFPPRITKVIQKALMILGIDRKNKFLLDSLRDRDVVRKWLIWSIFRKPQ
jgi:hypothetical protein